MSGYSRSNGASFGSGTSSPQVIRTLPAGLSRIAVSASSLRFDLVLSGDQSRACGELADYFHPDFDIRLAATTA